MIALSYPRPLDLMYILYKKQYDTFMWVHHDGHRRFSFPEDQWRFL